LFPASEHRFRDPLSHLFVSLLHPFDGHPFIGETEDSRKYYIARRYGGGR
jgi:hypothetical protein